MEVTEENCPNIRCKMRTEKYGHWKDKRQTAMNLNRPEISVEEDNLKDITLLELKHLAEDLKKKKNQNLLNKIQKALRLGEAYVAEFLKVNGALYTLTGILIGNDAELQLSAVGCVTNLTTACHKSTFTVLKATAPYLITFLHGGNPLIKEQSLWALGNMALDCEICRKQLIVQGLLPAVVPLLKSPHDNVLMAAMFCLRCFTRYAQNNTREFLHLGVGHLLFELTKRDSLDDEITADVCFVLFHFSASIGETEVASYFISHNFVEAILELFRRYCNDGNILVLTPLLRCLGNISNSCEAATKIISQSTLIPCVLSLMKNTYVHVRKELFWMLTNLICNSQTLEKLDLERVLRCLPEALQAKEEVVVEILNFLCALLSREQKWRTIITDYGIGEIVQSLTVSPYTTVSELASIALHFVKSPQ